MWRSKKLIVGAVLAAVLLFGSLGGIALADNGDGDQPGALFGSLWDRVCAIYAEKTGVTIDQHALQESFTEAQGEIRAEAMQNRLQNLVDQGEITQDEADQYLEWWQARPDVPAQFGSLGHGGFRGMGGPPGWGRISAPPE